MKIKNIAAVLSAAALVTSSAIADTSANLIAANPQTEESVFSMIPVRKVCEAIGIKVDWSEEQQRVTLTSDDLSISFSPDKDEYVINGTQTINLGIKPRLDYDTTYVPFEFASKILNIPVSSDENASRKVIILENNESNILVYDFVYGDVVLNITENTKIEDSKGNATEIAKISKGQIADVVFDDAMTLSLPPMTNAVKITTLASLAKEVSSEEKVFAETIYVSSEDGMYLLYDINRGGEVLVNVTENTAITDESGKAFDIANLEVGQVLEVVYDDIMTRSLPPMTNALEIIVKNSENKVVVTDVVASVEKDEDFVQIIVGDEKEVASMTAFNLSEDVKIKFLNGEDAKIDDIEAGMEITVVASSISTKSIPQQRTAYNIIIK